MINGRNIKNYGLNQAIHQGYHTLLPIHRSPIVVLLISMDAILVDVNVHPTKLEVRFSKEKELFQTVEDMIKGDRKSTRLNSSHVASSYAAYCMNKQTKTT